jgi:hypothetical protein
MAADMIAMVESGRLGNQVFQYLALRSVAQPRERLVLFGFDQLKDTFDGVDATFVHIETNPLKHLVSLDYDRVQRIAARLPGIGMIDEDAQAQPSRGSGSHIAIARPSWFQSELTPALSAVERLQIKPHLVETAQRFLDDNELVGSSTAFVHVRAGDYRTWPSPEHPAILPVDWYLARVLELRAERPDLAVVAIGDDAEYTKEVVDSVADARTFAADYAAEFALMSLCSSGVLSASSFAYWGAYFAKRRTPEGTFLAPEHWAGHASGSWYPEHIAATFIDYR